MIHRTFGQTGIEVSALGLGGMRFENPSDIDGMAAVVHHAFERGVTYFDTAPSYCDGKSEHIVGEAVKQMKKSGKPFYTATKTIAGDPDTIREQCERSIKRLNVDAIDFYHVWCLIRPEDLPERKAQGALDTFRRLKDEGLIRHICVSTHLEYEHIAAMLDQGEGLFEGMLIGLCALNYDLRYPGVREAAQRGMAVVTMNTLGGGLLVNHPGQFEFIMREDDETLVDAAIRFNLSVPEVSVALVGCRNKADVDAAVDAVERFDPLSPEEIVKLRRKSAEANKDFCTQCGYCRDCPAGVPVVRFMESYNVRMLEGVEACKSHLRWHWGMTDVCSLLDECTQCGQCEEACTQQLPILARFEELREDQRPGS